MQIASLDIRACRMPTNAADATRLSGVNYADGLEFLVYEMTTTCGEKTAMFGFAGANGQGSALLASSLKPFFVGRNVLDREMFWHKFRKQDRFWGHLPIYIYGAIDCCLWLLAAQKAQMPLYQYIGAFRHEVPVYVSSMFHDDDANRYVEEALKAKSEGYAGYKLHPPGHSLEEDIEIHRNVRHAVGDDYTLMSDPVSFMTVPEAVRYGRELEKLNFLWFEEPMPDESIPALRELSRTLDIPVVGTEVLAKHPYSLADCLASHVVDVVRADVSWSGGVTSVLKSAHLAESFNVHCEIHTAILHPLELVNLHLCAALGNCRFFELLYPVDSFAFGLKNGLPLHNGMAILPQTPGLGDELDWDLIENTTLARY